MFIPHRFNVLWSKELANQDFHEVHSIASIADERKDLTILTLVTVFLSK